MRLTQRLLLASLLVVSGLVVFILLVVDVRLREALVLETRRELQREAAAIAALWETGADPAAVARASGAALGHRVTLLDRDAVPLGDSELPAAMVGTADELRAMPEVALALRDGTGWHVATSGPGEDELRVAVRGSRGIVRIAFGLGQLAGAFDSTRRDLIVAGALAILAAAVMAWAFARDVSRPVQELRDVARAMAAGDLTRRPSLTAPGEIGDLATAVYRLAEQLDARLRALTAEDALLIALTEALNEGVMAIDRRQQVVRINATARRLFNLRDNIPFPAEHLPRDRALRDALGAALRGDATDAAEVTLADRTLLLAARPLPEGGAVLAAYDLTQIRRLESVRRDFVANVSHELRTPLTIVGGFAETLAEDDLSEEQRRTFAETIRQNAVRMQRIVDDLLDISRIESGGWVPKPQLVGARAVAADAMAAAAATADAKQLALAVEIAPGAEQLWADPTALRQVVGNLVDNAVRHTNAGEVRVTAEAIDGGVAIAVHDTGIGIPEEHLRRIFERFYRVDPARSRADGGTGLGLAIVRHLVDAHGGRVWAESTIGRGTTITATFPGPADDAPAHRGVVTGM